MTSEKINSLILILCLAFISGKVSAEITIEATNPDVNITANNPYIMRMNENNHQFNDKTELFKLTATDDDKCEKLSIEFVEPESFEYKTEECIFYASQSFDYENSNQRSYLLQIKSKTIDTDRITIRFLIQNIDDEPPVIGSFKCEFDEETIYTVENSSCSSTLTDPDGWLYEVKPKVNPGTGRDNNEDEIFEVAFQELPGDNVNSWPVYMYPKEKLKYNQTNFYIFSVYAVDGAGHLSEDNGSAIVNVKDLRNTYPIWTSLTKFKQFKEQEAQNFSVTAIDGDTGINDKICYYKVKEDNPEDNYISVNESSGLVDVKPINRDKDDLTFYKFEIEACVCELGREWCTKDEVTFVIEDIDNSPPQIMSNNYNNGTNQTFKSDEEKIVRLSYLENYSQSYNFSTIITDNDTGVNAQFEVSLKKYGGDDDIDYTVAYMIVPGAGYRTGSFQISVKNNTFLDYENNEWKSHKYYVVSLGKGEKLDEMNDTMLINVDLIDYNDEYPIFDETSYSTSMKETVVAGYEVIKTHATDLDAEDEILEMNIVGSYVEERFDIDTDGLITVKKNGSFDYDILKSVYFQVTATDKAKHVTSVPVTIKIIDVNNKAPVINPVTRVFVEENQKNGALIDIEITATDVDTKANLTSYIDWNSTTITKTNSYVEINDEIEKAMKFLVVENNVTNNGRGLSIKLRVVNNNEDNPDKPDFELFDTLYLALIVEDLNTDPDFEDQRTTAGTIVISITDINDNPPTFPDSNYDNRTADEAASKGASVGFIKATDVDTVTSEITYYCVADDKEFDWIEVDETSGALTVKNEGEIDADIPITNFTYKCWAYDGLYFSQPLSVSIYVVDTNNKNPEIHDKGPVHVDEKSPPDTNISYLSTSDKDRDVPFHTVSCSFQTYSTSDDENVCDQKFYFDSNTIFVRNGGNDLNRDTGPTNYTCTVRCSDNIYNERSQGIRSADYTQIIVLDDINDNDPLLNTTELECYETLKKGEEIGVILGTDIDEGLNAEIVFSILSVTKDGKDYKDLFEIKKINEDYEYDAVTKQVHLIATENLQDQYGSYEMSIFLEDQGDPPRNSSGSITLTINKFNYISPQILFPVDKEKYNLLSFQIPGKPLDMFKDNTQLKNFQATDGISEECPKWDVIFELDQYEADFFVLQQQGDIKKCQSQLTINDKFASEDVLKKQYPLKITASVKEGTEEDGEAPYSTSVTITIIFVDNNLQPTFNENTWNVSFVEANSANLTQVEPMKNKATYDVEDADLPIFYYIYEGDDTINSLFKVDENTGDLSVIGIFYYDDNPSFEFQIVASNDSNLDTCTNLDSYLNVTITVLSSNRRWPTWTNSPYFGAIMPDLNSGYTVLTAQAHDEDAIDQGHLECNISSEFGKYGEGLDKLEEPFIMESNSDSGKINLNFRVESSMSGFFKFKISVSDKQDIYGQGPHTNETDVTIFIITSENTVDFRFYNEKTEVIDRETEMLKIITEEIGYQAYRQSIDDQIADDSTITTARLYFIETNGDTFNLIKGETILGIVGSVSTYAKLSTRLRREQQLILSNFDSTNTNTTNSEAVLRAWLTGVSVILGTLIIILLITLVLKTRQLNGRISRLTTKKFGSQDSGLNRIGVTAPTTNKHTIEGSNPVYKSEKTTNISDLDTHSVGSGDSELIGVEENPEFDYNFNPTDKNTYLR